MDILIITIIVALITIQCEILSALGDEDIECINNTSDTNDLINLFQDISSLPPYWDSFCDACDWSPLIIKCDSDAGRITELALFDSENYITSGTLNEYGSWPSYMLNIDMRNQYLMGDFNFSKLPNVLKYLQLINNRFTGGLPFEKLPTTLLQLSLQNNFFSGTLDFDQNRSGILRYLDLSDNNFIGDLDMKSCAANYPFLTELYLSSNQLNGTLDMSSIPEYLTILNVSFNSLHAYIPPKTEVAKLVNLIISNNHFNGILNVSAGTDIFKKLTLFDASFNDFTNLSVNDFGAESLTTLKLDHNLFANKDDNDFLSNFPSTIQYLFLDHNLFSVNMKLEDYCDLIELQVNNNSLTSLNLDSFATYAANIEKISAQFNDIVIIHWSFGEFGGYSPVQGFISTRLPSTLHSLNLSFNQMIGNVIIDFGDESPNNLSFIDLSNNLFDTVIFVEGSLEFDVWLDESVICHQNMSYLGIYYSGKSRNGSFCNNFMTCIKTCANYSGSDDPSISPTIEPTIANPTVLPTFLPSVYPTNEPSFYEPSYSPTNLTFIFTSNSSILVKNEIITSGNSAPLIIGIFMIISVCIIAGIVCYCRYTPSIRDKMEEMVHGMSTKSNNNHPPTIVPCGPPTDEQKPAIIVENDDSISVNDLWDHPFQNVNDVMVEEVRKELKVKIDSKKSRKRSNKKKKRTIKKKKIPSSIPMIYYQPNTDDDDDDEDDELSVNADEDEMGKNKIKYVLNMSFEDDESIDTIDTHNIYLCPESQVILASEVNGIPTVDDSSVSSESMESEEESK